jgi:hypothetical protein
VHFDTVSAYCEEEHACRLKIYIFYKITLMILFLDSRVKVQRDQSAGHFSGCGSGFTLTLTLTHTLHVYFILITVEILLTFCFLYGK